MRDIFITLVVFGLLPYVLKRSWWGIILSAWLGYMNPHLLAYGFAQTMPYVMIVALTTLLAMFIAKEKYKIIWTRESILLVILLIWMAVTTFMAIYPALAWEQYVKVLKIQILTFMTIMLINSQNKLNALVWIIVLSLGFYGIKGGIFTIVHGGVYRVQGPLRSFIGGNNEIAMAMMMTIPLMRYLQLQEKKWWLKWGLIGAMFLTAIAVIGSQSRGALVGLSIMSVIFWLKSRYKITTLVFLAVAGFTIINIMPQKWYDRMHTIETYEEDKSAQGRINAWWTAYNLAKDRVTGGGFETFRWRVFQAYAPDKQNVRDVHSIYFEIMGEHGFTGLAIYLSLIASTWLRCSGIIRRCKKVPDKKWAADLGAMIQVSIIGYAASGVFLGLAYFDYLYHLIAMAIVLGAISTAQSVETIANRVAFNPTVQPKILGGAHVQPAR